MTLPLLLRPRGRPPTLLQIRGTTLVLIYLIALSKCSTASYINHHSIAFTSSVYNATVHENAFGNTPVKSHAMMGVYLPDPSYSVKYRIVGGDNHKFFRCSERVLGNFCFLEIHVRTGNTRNLNRESQDRFTLKVKALQRRHDRTNEDIPGALTEVSIKVIDVNDLSPFFLESEYRINLSEDSALYSSVIRIKAEDPDDGLNGQVYYSFKEATNEFALHPTSGVVSLTRPLRYHEKSEYKLTLVAEDRGYKKVGASFPSEATLSVSVKEVNVFEPQIEVTHLAEAAASGHLIILAIVNVIDNDRGPSGEINSLEIIEGDQEGVFRILPGSAPHEFNLASLQTIRWEDAPFGYNLTLKAVDKGARPRFSYKLVRLDPPPTQSTQLVFKKELYNVNISEAAPPGSHVVQVSSWIPGTQTRVTFSISAGNDGGEFQLDATTGTLTTAMFLDAEMRDTYSLTIDASTAAPLRPRQQASARVVVKVLDANDNAPMIVAPQGIVQVDENQRTQSFVVNVRAQDYDSGENGHVSYSLANEEDVPFSIDHFTGEVRTTRQLDFETERRSYRLRVRASDWGEPYRRQTEKILTINVLDVNDNRPQFDKVACTGTVARSTPIGSEILNVTAIDFDAGNIITYRVVGGNNDRCFSLDSVTGMITLTCDLHDVIRDTRYLNVTASDGQHFSDVMFISMKLEPHVSHTSYNKFVSFHCKEMGVARQHREQLVLAAANNVKEKEATLALLNPPPSSSNFHTPQIKKLPGEVRIRENSDVGTSVIQIKSHDSDVGYDGDVLYTISSGNIESVFQIDAKTGDITVAGHLDRERVPQYTLNLTVYDQGHPRRSSSHPVVISLVDENDNNPKFEKPSYRFYMPESVINGTSVRQLVAHDPDAGAFGLIKYSLATDTRDFSLDPNNGQLIVSRPLDYEKQSVYELRIVAEDGGARSTHTYVTVEVMNINDCAPVFPDTRAAEVRIPEDLPVGSLVTLVTARDPDSTLLRYTLESNHQDIFTLDEDTGALRLTSPLDFETRHAYNISVRATDDGVPPLSSITHLIVLVVDVDENQHNPTFGRSVANATILEDAPPHSLVVAVPATDEDVAPLDKAVTYTLIGAEGQGLFYINQRGEIYTSAWLDRESQAWYWLTVQARDSGTVPRHATLHVYVEVGNVNDHRPLSEWAVYWPAVLENTAPNTVLLTVQAHDPDPGSGLSYAITAGNPQSLFTIDDRTGEIRTTQRRLDREQQAEHVLEVTISDSPDEPGSHALSSVAMVIVNVLDENDHAPEFLESVYQVSVPLYGFLPGDAEQDGVAPFTTNTRGGDGGGSVTRDQQIFQVLAFDRDEGEHSEIIYSLLPSNWSTLFKVHPRTGSIYAPPNLDPSQSYGLTVEARDGGRPSKSSRCLVKVTAVPVAPSSPHPPVIEGPPSSQITVLENDAIGHLVKLIEANDDDDDQLYYDIVDGNADRTFAIGRNKGNLVVAAPLDAEQTSSYTLTVSVTDGVHIVSCQVLVAVVDINDNRPRFSLPVYEVEVSENTRPGTTVFTLQASDRDLDNHLQFSLANAAHLLSETKFRIGPINGDVVLTEPLDREVQDEHVLTVRVKDRMTPVKNDFARLKIKVRDYNDHKPTFLSSLYNGSVDETAGVGTSVLQVLAVDHDIGTNGHVTYSIVSGNIGGVFSLDPATGVISVGRPLDRRELPEYWLSVRAGDSGSPAKHSMVNVNILIKMAREASPRFLEKEFIFEVSERSRVGDYVGTLSVESRLGVVFSLIKSPTRSKKPFVINPATGILALDAPLDYEIIQSYNLTVRALSMNGKESTCKIIVNVLDENDNAPMFSLMAYSGHISEAAAINSVVLQSGNSPLVITARDKDTEQNANLVFTILEEEARMYFAIDSSTGAIRSVGPLDHEVVSSVKFSVSVRDSGEPTLTAPTTAAVTVVIDDINDVPPRFLQTDYNATVLLPTQKTVLVTQLNATDLDFNGEAPLHYEIADGNKEAKFFIDPQTGLITVNDSSDMAANYKLKVIVSDGQYSSSTTVNIKTEQLPRTSLRFSRDQYFAAVEENSRGVDKVVLVQAQGSELNEHLKFRILNPSNMFTIGETSGVIMTAGRPFDREQQDSYQLVAEVRSTSITSPRRISHVPVHVVVLDKNDNAPIFVNTPYYGVVPVDSKKDKVIFKVQATDFDADENKEVRYELRRGNGELFLINRVTGELRLRQELRGLQSDYELTVVAYDGGTPPLSSEVIVRLKVVDRSQPIFRQQFYSAEVSESAELHSPALSVKAHSQLNRKLFYAIVAGPDHHTFGIEHEEGIIRVQDILDYETRPSYRLTVRAIDTISGKFAEVDVSISVLDENDHPPKFSQHFYNISVSEATAIATPILQIETTDEDTGVNAGVSYRLEDANGTLPQNFFMEGDSGLLILKKGLDRESNPSHLFKIIASDTGKTPLSSLAYVLVTVLDMNDNPPLFERPYHRCWVSQGAPRNHFVTLVSASDEDTSDAEQLSYAIVNGNEAQTFSIEASTGIVRIWNTQKLLDSSQHLLNISVSDGVFTSFTRLDIVVSPVNDHSPVFQKDKYEATVSENLPPMTQVTRVQATDGDNGHYGQFSYHFVGDEAHKYFRINENTGYIWTTSEFDRESAPDHTYTIVAVDGGGRTGFTTLEVGVADVNDNKPVFSQPNYKVLLPANVTQNEVVIKVDAQDIDAGTNGTVAYFFHTGTPRDTVLAFAVNELSGEITVRGNSRKLAPGNVFEFFLEARDGGEAGQQLSSVTVVLVRVISEDTAAPEFFSAVNIIPVWENATLGSQIGSVAARWQGELEYTLEWVVKDVTPPLAVSPDGALSLSTLLDHEAMSQALLVVTAAPRDLPELAVTTTVLLEVHDVNDQEPTFESQRYYVSVAENTPAGSNIIKVHARDRDSGSNAEVRYLLEEPSEGRPLLESEPLFTLDPYSGWLSLNRPLDADQQSKYQLKVLVHDNGNPSLSSSCIVEVQVKDYNDNPPNFSKDVYLGTVREDSQLGTVVAQLEVIDLDLTDDVVTVDRTEGEQRSPVEYYITSGNPRHQFHVRSSGEIYVNRPLDREDIGSYSLGLTATDGTFVTQTQVKINIMDVNDNPPICTSPYYHLSVSEMTEVGSSVVEVSAYDPDLIDHSRYYLSDTDSDSFLMDQTTGQLTLSKQLDRELQASYSLIVTVRDSSISDWKCSCQVNIEVLDINDNPPLFNQRSFSVNVPENSPENRQLMKIHATDPDTGLNRQVSYSLAGDEIFVLDRVTGILSVMEQLDRERRAMYNLTVTAWDHGSPKLSTKTTVMVFVSDVNDNPPEFASHTYSTTIPESARVGTDVTRVLANSRDIGKNAEITYSIIGGNEHRKFAIHSKTGVVSILDEIDYERARVYQLTIQATDGGKPPLSNQATVNVTITDINDNPPIFIQNSYSALVNEAADRNERLVQVVATDQDRGKNSEISYSITRGDPHGQFRIDPVTGWISVADKLDRESVRSYTLEILALDHGIPQRSGSVGVYIDVTDANDNAPVFVEANHSLYVQDDKPISHLVHQFEVTDRDDNDRDDRSYRNGSPFIFEIRSGNVNNAFRITESGELRTATIFNHKHRNHFRLQIGVYDSGNPPLYSETWLDIKIIEESQYPPVVMPLQAMMFVQAGEYYGGVIGKLHASDQDPYDSLIYEIVPSMHNSRYFAIDRADGTFSAKGRLDQGIYSINVSVSDGKFTTHSGVTVEMVDVDDEMLKNAVIVRLAGASAQDFLLSYRRNFHRGIRNILNIKSRDIIILGLQTVPNRHRRDERKKYMQNLMSSIEEEIDVLFVVRKGEEGYFPRNFVRKRVMSELDNLERAIQLRVSRVAENECQKIICANGQCDDQILLEDDQVVISTDAMSFVSLEHHHRGVCICPPGYAGSICDKVINECAYQPCPTYKQCVPDRSSLGYSCECPEGLVGATCSQSKGECIGKESTPACYMAQSPLSFKGKSFAHYQLHVPIERHFSFSVWFRTLHQSGNIMFTSGRLDYGILELAESRVQYRWDLGSGEGIVKVLSHPLNDSQWHNVFLERTGSTVRLLVDNLHKSEGSSAGSSEMLNLETPDLYLGAEVRPWAGADDPRHGFSGCMDDPRVYDSKLPVTLTTSPTATLVRLTQVAQHCHGSLQTPGACGAYPCLNGGTCEDRGASFYCRCQSRFKGNSCEIDSDPCASSPCLNNGRCTNVGDSYLCHCPLNISGPRCQHMFCNPNPCQNKGICEEGISGPICKCRGFVGLTCDIDINECEKNPCQEDVQCINTLGGYRCDCPHDMSGPDCMRDETSFFTKFRLVMYIVAAVSVLCLLVIAALVAVLCLRRRTSRQVPPADIHNKLDTADHGTLFSRSSKLSNLDAAPSHHHHHVMHHHGCTASRDPYSSANLPSEPVYMPLNNFDTIRSYTPSPKHDQLDNLPPFSREFAHNINKPSHSGHNTLPPSCGPPTSPKCMADAGVYGRVGVMGGSRVTRTLPPGMAPPAAVPDHLYKDALGHNLKEAYYDGGKIPNDVKFAGGGQCALCVKRSDASPDDASVLSAASGEDLPDYHWDCSDWARPSQNPLPNIVEVPGGELPDTSSYHSNESNESIPQQKANRATHHLQSIRPPVAEPVNPERDMDTLALDELTSDCGTDFELDSRPDLEPSHTIGDSILDPGTESDTSLFVPQPLKYKSHPNQYLPRYQAGSETDAEEERMKLLNHGPASPVSAFRSPQVTGISRSSGPATSPTSSSPHYRSPYFSASPKTIGLRGGVGSSSKDTTKAEPRNSGTASSPLASSGYPRMGVRKLPNSSSAASSAAPPSSSSALPAGKNLATHSPELPSSYQARNNRRYDTSSAGPRAPLHADEFEVLSLCGHENSNTSASDLDNVCEIEDSEINSEFEN